MAGRAALHWLANFNDSDECAEGIGKNSCGGAWRLLERS
jgi:hypothetical protein